MRRDQKRGIKTKAGREARKSRATRTKPVAKKPAAKKVATKKVAAKKAPAKKQAKRGTTQRMMDVTNSQGGYVHPGLLKRNARSLAKSKQSVVPASDSLVRHTPHEVSVTNLANLYYIRWTR
jgi:hypothetical protein